MKTNKLLAFMAMSAICVFSCNPEKTDPVKPDPQPEEKSTECKLIKLVAVTSDGELEAGLYSNEKVAEISYLGEQFEGLKNATLKVEVSPKATTNLEEGKVYDLTTEVPEFTITAEDGEHMESGNYTCKSYSFL